LVENINARRPPSNKALLFEVRSLTEKRIQSEEISQKLGLEKKLRNTEFVQLLKKGEEVLLQAVDDGRIPLSNCNHLFLREQMSRCRKLSSRRMKRGDLRGAKLADRRRIIAIAHWQGIADSEQSLRPRRRFGCGRLIAEYEPAWFSASVLPVLLLE